MSKTIYISERARQETSVRCVTTATNVIGRVYEALMSLEDTGTHEKCITAFSINTI